MDVLDKDYNWSSPENQSFVDQMMFKNGIASRDRVIGDIVTVVQAKFKQD